MASTSCSVDERCECKTNTLLLLLYKQQTTFKKICAWVDIKRAFIVKLIKMKTFDDLKGVESRN